jgi:hypothetical protein
MTMLNSERSTLLEKIKQAEHKATEQYYLGLNRALGVVNRADYLTEEQKQKLAEDFLK